MFAVITSGAKQFKVHVGDVIYVEKLNAQDGDDVNFDVVMTSGDDGEVTLGAPTVKGATVTGKVLKQVKGEKLIVYKYKAKKNYHKKAGHRQPYTRVEITQVSI